MAEALGFAASVIAVVDMTTKVGSASFKLMRLWSEVKEVPVMLRGKAERIKDLEDFLDDAEIQMANNQLPRAVYNMARLQKHIVKARCALTDVQEMVDELQAKANAGQRGLKRRFASTKVLLRKDQWNALDKSLDSALYLLSIAQTQYLVAMSTFCTTFILEEQPRSTRIPGQSLIKSGDTFETGEVKKHSIQRRKPNYAHSTVANVFHMPHYSNSFLPTFRFAFGAKSNFQFSVLTPTWLSGSVYSILAQRSFQGWQLNLRAYEVIEDFPGELYHCIKMDDYLGLFQCLDGHKINPHARNKNGADLLWLAVASNAFTTTKSLLERGLYGHMNQPISTTDSTPCLSFLITMNIPSSRSRDLQFLKLCADHGLYDALNRTEIIYALLGWGASYPAFRTILGLNNIFYEFLSIEIRIQHLRELAYSGGYWGPDEIKQIVPETEELNAEIIKLSVEEGCAFLHSFALVSSRRLATWVNRTGSKQRLEEEKLWSELIHSCISQDSASLHRLESIWNQDLGYIKSSPFSSILLSFLSPRIVSYQNTSWKHASLSARQAATAMELVLTAWIATLADCGVDLMSYGRQERQLYDESSTWFKREFVVCVNMAEAIGLSLISLTYGSRPEQWKLWWAVEYENYAGEFWDLVECRGFKMPGSWVDEPWDIDGFEGEESRRFKTREMEDTTPLIWSEYRKIRPPV